MGNAENAPAEIGIVFLEGCRCRCGHQWLPREKREKPRVCPLCKSPNWDKPYTIRKKTVKAATDASKT
jgi:predicted Zn-ribbon and HTH transcriptional regulator